MPSPIPRQQWQGTYGKLHDLAGNFSVEFDAGKSRLQSEMHNGKDRIYDRIDGVYEEAVEAGLDYQAVQVLSAIAVIEASEFNPSGDMLPADRSVDD
jgi:hypothetical protein